MSSSSKKPRAAPAKPIGLFWAPVPAIANFFRKLHAKNGEWILLVPGIIVASIIIFKTDVVLPGYSRAIGGEFANKEPDRLETYKLEPIKDDSGKVIAMRKVVKNKRPSPVFPSEGGGDGEQ